MRTAEQIARICGVSPQAVREWCRKRNVRKDAKGKFLIDGKTETLILEYYGVTAQQEVAQDAQADSRYLDTLIDLLRDELAVKDEQIREKDRQIEHLQASLSKALDQQQQLAAMSEQRKIAAYEPDQPEEQPQKRRWWQFGRKEDAE